MNCDRDIKTSSLISVFFVHKPGVILGSLLCPSSSCHCASSAPKAAHASAHPDHAALKPSNRNESQAQFDTRGHYWDYYPGVVSLIQIYAIHLKIVHQ